MGMKSLNIKQSLFHRVFSVFLWPKIAAIFDIVGEDDDDVRLGRRKLSVPDQRTERGRGATGSAEKEGADGRFLGARS